MVLQRWPLTTLLTPTIKIFQKFGFSEKSCLFSDATRIELSWGQAEVRSQRALLQ
jgi:hypothetical protein